MGRPERPIDPAAGPVADIASRLRALRRQAGSPTYRALGRQASFAPSVLSSAASGQTLPSLQVTLAFVRACGGDPAEWTTAWHTVANAVGKSTRKPAATRPVPAQLPPRPTAFAGRVAEAARLRGQLLGDRPVVVHGLLGSGKTAFATYVAHQLRHNWPDGQLYADLGTSSTDAVLGWFIQSLGVSASLVPADTEQRAGLYRSLLAGRRVFVFLDGVADEPQVRPLLPPTPSSQLLITSRSRLAGLASVRRIALNRLSPDDSIALLGGLVGQQRIDAERRIASDIAVGCDNLALALWIVGAKTAARPDLTLRQVADQLRQAPLEWLRVGDVSIQDQIAKAYLRLSPFARNTFLTPADGLIDTLLDQGLLESYHWGYRLPTLFRRFALVA